MARAAKRIEPVPQGAVELDGILPFLSLLWELDHRLRSASKRMATELGVTGPQRLVIRILGQQPNLSAGQIAQLLHLHPSTLTGVLDRLERSALIVRTADERDGRRFRFQLSPRGKRTDAVHDGTVEARVRAALSRLPSKDIEATERLLRALAAELD
ncbi:MAG: MarR family winged helix-turn-helix transcriptional regulator [Deltaproteobacteria bacterium]